MLINQKNRNVMKYLKGAKGFTLVEILVSIFLVCVLSFGIAGSLGQFSAQQHDLMSRLSTMSLTANLRRTLLDDSALLNTLFNKDNQVFDCLRAASLNPLGGAAPVLPGCENNTGTLKNLISSSGQQLVDLSDTNQGFTSGGEACTGYGTDPKCNIRVKIEVSYICEQGGVAATGCTQPQIVFTGSLEILGGGPNGSTLNLANVFEVRKDWNFLKTNLVELSGADAVANPAAAASFKLALIIDNSTSMVSYQQKLSASLDPLFESLKNTDTEFVVQIYTTSQYLMRAPSNYQFPRPINSDHQLMSLAPVTCSDGVTTKPGYCEDLIMAGMQNEKYSLKPPIEKVLPASPSVADFAAFKADILNTVANMGVSGSDKEQGLCTLSRLLAGGNGFINAGDKLGVVIISNEQDQSTAATCATEIDRKYTPNGPTDRIEGFQCNNETTADPSTDFSEFKVKVQVGSAGYRIDFRCQARHDGGFVPYDANDSSTYIQDTAFPNFNAVYHPVPSVHSLQYYGLDISKTCAASGIAFTGSKPYEYAGDSVTVQTAECPAAVRDAIAKDKFCGAEYDGSGNLVQAGAPVPGIVGCKISCNDKINYGLFDVKVPSGAVEIFRQTGSWNVNYCAANLNLGAVETDTVEYPNGSTSSTTYKKIANGGSYSNVGAVYTAGNMAGKPLWTPFGAGASTNCCRVNYFHRPISKGIGDVYKSVFESFGTQSLPIEDAIVERANALLGTDGYFISSIINPSDPAKACPISNPDESVGTVFESLAGKITNSVVVPICAADYSDALLPLQQFIQTTVLTQKENDLIELAQGEQIVQIYVNNGTTDYQFPVAGPNGVWPTLVENVAASTNKIYRLDFSKTGYTLAASDRVWALVSSQKGSLSLGSIGIGTMTFDEIRSLYRIGLGH